MSIFPRSGTYSAFFLRTLISSRGCTAFLSRTQFSNKASFDESIPALDVGFVQSITDGIASVYGLSDVQSGEMVTFSPSGVRGLALNLNKKDVGIVLFGPDQDISAGDKVYRSKTILDVSVGMKLLGRVVDALGKPVDGLGELGNRLRRDIERVAPGIISRKHIKRPLQTGIKVIDGLVPIGRGQRELIIGDRQTGKTAIIIDTILNQNNAKKRGRKAYDFKKETPYNTRHNMYCIYVGIGQKRSTIGQIYHFLQRRKSMYYTVIVAATAAEPASMQYLAPYAGTAMGEFFRDGRKDAIIFYDDLSKHAVAYRQMSLLLRRPPSREAFPGDVFYLHSRLLERSCQMSKDLGSGSLTAMPVVETQAGDVAAYIPTNVISITDGQIFLETDLFNNSQRPAVSLGLSVSRVGAAAQLHHMKRAVGSLKLRLADYREVESFAQFGAADMDETTQYQLDSGVRILEIMKQEQYAPVPVNHLIMFLKVINGKGSLLNKIELGDIKTFEKRILSFFRVQGGFVSKQLSRRKFAKRQMQGLYNFGRMCMHNLRIGQYGL